MLRLQLPLSVYLIGLIKPAACCAMAPSAATEELRPLANHVAQAVQDSFRSLAKNGKPQAHEHTVLAGRLSLSLPWYSANATAYNLCTCHNAGIVAYSAPDAADTEQQHLEGHNSCCQLHYSLDCSAASSEGSGRRIHVIALGTGTKCLGGKQRSAAGDVLNDSHAEVITRRAFLAWIYQQLMIAAESFRKTQQIQAGQQHESDEPAKENREGACMSAFYWCPTTSKFKLHPGIRFAMYISQPPCGDASIYTQPCQQCEPAATQPAQAAAHKQGDEHHHQQQHAGSGTGQPPLSNGGGKTGAKLIKLVGAGDVSHAAAPVMHNEQSDFTTPPCKQQGQQQQKQQHSLPVVPGASDVEVGPQALGVLRRKPGKGDPTLSLSCSDKIAKWTCLGLQGCLLSDHLANPLYLTLLVVGVPGSAAAAATSQPAVSQGMYTAVCAPLGPGDVSPDQSTAILQAVEAAGVRAFSDRLSSSDSLLHPPFARCTLSVVAVEPAARDLGLHSSNERKVPSGKAPANAAIIANLLLPSASAAQVVHLEGSDCLRCPEQYYLYSTTLA